MKELEKIKERLRESSEMEGEEYKWKCLRNDDIDFFINTIESQEREIERLLKVNKQ